MKTFSRDLTKIVRSPLKSATGLLGCLFAILLASSSLCYGQDVSGMTGEVTDPSGATLSGATVTLTNAATGTKFTATTNSQGVYRFSEIPPGQGYEATFAASGFSAVEVKNIYLTVATIRTQNATLKVGAQAKRLR